MNEPTRRGVSRPIHWAIICSRGFLILGGLLALILILLARAPRSATAQANHYIPMLLWPVPDEYRWVMAYPDHGWTWRYLGLVPGKTCPPNSKREREKSAEYWRDEGTDENADWSQASRGTRHVACYWHHAGVDIFVDPGTPVYAVADGTVTLVSEATDPQGNTYAYVEIEHNRVWQGKRYVWQARYLHLMLLPPVTTGPISEGTLLGYVIYIKNNTHLHFEVDDFWPDCLSPNCITNPYGETALWIDYADDGKIDPATNGLGVALNATNLVANSEFNEGMQHWAASPAVVTDITQDGRVIAYREAGGSVAWIKQVLGYRFDADTSITVRLKLGNTSSVPKLIGVSLRHPETWKGAILCQFAIPPKTSPQIYTMQGTISEEWLNAILYLSLNPADGKSGVVFDAITVARDDSLAVTATRCLPPSQ